METPNSQRIHISIFGKCNSGKSTLANAILGQELSIVSDTKGTTTDPVFKAMELLPLGPVVITDTAGFDDDSQLGEKRIAKTRQILNKTDIAILVVAEDDLSDSEKKFTEFLEQKKIPSLIFKNDRTEKIDREKIIGKIVQVAKENISEKKILEGIASKGDTVVLVCPIDDAAPKGRMILPQMLVLRELLDMHAKAVVIQPEELEQTVEDLKVQPKIVITDSQAFKAVAQILPDGIPLTSFSILMARYKGYLNCALRAVDSVKELKDGDRILISEGCTHHRQCGDIGSVKIPMALKKITGKHLEFTFTSGTEFPEHLGDFSLVIHCGGCMVTEREILYRMKCAEDQQVPFCNYGIFLAMANGILQRAVEPVKKSVSK